MRLIGMLTVLAGGAAVIYEVFLWRPNVAVVAVGLISACFGGLAALEGGSSPHA